MTNGDEPINPNAASNIGGSGELRYGLTKREYYAGLAMQAVIQNPRHLDALLAKYPIRVTDQDASLVTGLVAVEYADALIDALNKESK